MQKAKISKNQSTKKRDNKWLNKQLHDLWENYFADVPRKNLVIIKFGRASKRQLGSIKWANKKTRIKSIMKRKEIQQIHQVQDDKRVTVITITKKFQDLKIPKYVVLSTIAHELCHYTHGFSSPQTKQYKYPHQGSVVIKELKARGLSNLYKKARKWLKANWLNYI
jgi:hypothetical protein